MANVSVNITEGISGAGISSSSVVNTIAGNISVVFNDDVAIGTNFHIPLPTIDVSTASLVWVKASANCTLKTNSSGSPDETLALIANVPRLFYTNKPAGVAPFSTDITNGVYITNAAPMTLQILVIMGADVIP
jgi:hypothetical protein